MNFCSGVDMKFLSQQQQVVQDHINFVEHIIKRLYIATVDDLVHPNPLIREWAKETYE